MKHKNIKNKSFNDVKISKADIAKYVKKLSIVSKSKIIGSVIAGVALVGASVGTATYFAINKQQGTVTPYTNQCIIIFDSDGGSAVNPLTVEKGKKIDKLSESKKEGYDFQGWWYTNDKGQYVKFDNDTVVNTNLTLHAKWSIPIPEKGLAYKYYDGYGYYVYCDNKDKLPSKIRIPETYEDPITGIKDKVVGFNYIENDYSSGAFLGCNQLEEVELPNTISGIDFGAFSYCPLLRKINIPNNVSYIGEGAFYGCLSLEEINLPEGLVSIGEYAFGTCGLKKIVLPSSLKLLNAFAFRDNNSLYNVDIKEGLNTIPYEAFGECKNLAYVTIPISVTSIGDNAFYGSNLMSVTLKDSFSEWTSRTGNTISTELEFINALINGGQDGTLTKNTYPDSTNTYKIEFLGYTDDPNVINCGVQYIGQSKEVTIEKELKINGYDNLIFKPIRISKDFDQYSSGGISKVTLNENITSIAPEAFYDMYIEEIDFAEGEDINLESIGDRAFYYTYLSKFNSDTDGVLNFPESLKYIGPSCFGSIDDGFNEVRINSNIEMKCDGEYYDDTYGKWMDNFPFANNNVIKYTVNEDNDYYTVDEDTNALYSLVDDEINTLIAYPSFTSENPEDLIIKIADDAINVADTAFEAHWVNRYATKIQIPSSLQDFGYSLNWWEFNSEDETPFGYLKSFELLEPGSSFFAVSSDGSTLFNNDKTELIKYANGAKEGPLDYTVDDSVTKICNRAFFYNENLNSIKTNNVTLIEQNAFEYCSSLTKVEMPNVETLKGANFYGAGSKQASTEIYIGENCKNVSMYNFGEAKDNFNKFKIYIDSPIIANLKAFDEEDLDNNFGFFKENMYIKSTLVESLSESSFIKQHYEPKGKTPEGYTLFIYKE